MFLPKGACIKQHRIGDSLPIRRRDILSFPRRLQDVEREAILAALEYFKGDKNLAGGALGISYRVLWNKMNRHGFNTKGRDYGFRDTKKD